MNSDT